jgi:sarcosine oxidase subunit beta
VKTPRAGDRYWRPEVGGKILVGSVEPECDEPFWDYPADPDALDTSFTEQITNQVWRAVSAFMAVPIFFPYF